MVAKIRQNRHKSIIFYPFLTQKYSLLLLRVIKYSMPGELSVKKDEKIDYSCRHCQRQNNSRQARFSHEKICPKNPANIAKSPDAKENPIVKNREIYEQETGLTIPKDEIDEDENPEPEEIKGIDPLLLLLGAIILVFAGALFFRDKIVSFYRAHGAPS